MIPLLSREQVRALDQSAIEQGVPGVVLMENAGAQAAALLLASFPERLSRVLLLGGIGQNGGDAWVVARHLLCAGEKPRCVLVGERERVQGDALINLRALEALGVQVESGLDNLQLLTALHEATLIVDGLVGTGLDRPLRDELLALVEAINRAKAPRVSLDLPSGIDANTGQVLGAAVQAQLTVTFAAHKLGLHQHPAVTYVGELVCAGIGVPLPASNAGLIEARDVAALLPSRASDAHKGSNGHVLVIAGSAGKTGAALLCGLGAQRAGAGLVTIASDGETCRALDHKVVELMTAELAPRHRAQTVLRLADGKRAAVVGPGLGTDDHAQAFARDLARDLPIPTVLDADALTALAEDPSVLRDALGPRVLTPHPGEAARLLGMATVDVQACRVGCARALATSTGHVVVLKGARTVVAAPDGSLRISRSGTPALGSGGTGDVLAGVIAALCVELDPFHAAACGVELHARAGELAARSDRGLLAHEVAAALPEALALCRRA